MGKKIIFIILIAILIVGGLLAYRFFSKNKSQPPAVKLTKMIKILSSAFPPNEIIPQKYTCDGQDINPSLIIEGVPAEAKSLALIVDDPDAPGATFNHWLVFNIIPGVKEIRENSVPDGAILGRNDFDNIGYGGPCPPSGIHRYFFRAYALDTILSIPPGAKRSTLEKAMENHVLDQGELMGKYARE